MKVKLKCEALRICSAAKNTRSLHIKARLRASLARSVRIDKEKVLERREARGRHVGQLVEDDRVLHPVGRAGNRVGQRVAERELVVLAPLLARVAARRKRRQRLAGRRRGAKQRVVNIEKGGLHVARKTEDQPQRIDSKVK